MLNIKIPLILISSNNNGTMGFNFFFFFFGGYMAINLMLKCRSIGNRAYRATTWQIIFDLKNVNKAGKYTLQLAIASANDADLQV